MAYDITSLHQKRLKTGRKRVRRFLPKNFNWQRQKARTTPDDSF
jgi:hypothetical protein